MDKDQAFEAFEKAVKSFELGVILHSNNCRSTDFLDQKREALYEAAQALSEAS